MHIDEDGLYNEVARYIRTRNDLSLGLTVMNITNGKLLIVVVNDPSNRGTRFNHVDNLKEILPKVIHYFILVYMDVMKEGINI